jgi:phage N-6-adenine-methyltransferase
MSDASNITRKKRRDVTAFDPTRTRLVVASADEAIKQAQKIQDWPELKEAVEVKVQEQAEFLVWWQTTVTPNRHSLAPEEDRNDRTVISATDAEVGTGITVKQVSRWSQRLKNPAKYRADLYGAAYHKAMADKSQSRGTFYSGEYEWYTPAKYIALAREVLGEIDLDPASSDGAQKTVRAGDYFTKEDDGLSKEWHGRVFLNPPYAQPLVSEFIAKMVTEYRAHHVTAGILLTNDCTDTAWFHEAALNATAICFTRGRIRFYNADGVGESPTQGQCFYYFGPDVERFASRFADIGIVMKPFVGEVA